MKKLTRLVSEVLRIPEESISDSLSITNTENWDSLKHMELIVSIEETFHINLTTDEIVSMINMSKIKAVLISKKVDL